MSNKIMPRVTFSRFSKLDVIPSVRVGLAKSRWYCEDDERIFKHALSNDISRMRNALVAGKAEDVNEGFFNCEYVGIENNLSPTLLRLVLLKRRKHVSDDLAEQRRFSCGKVDEELAQGTQKGPPACWDEMGPRYAIEEAWMVSQTGQLVNYFAQSVFGYNSIQKIWQRDPGW